MVANNIPPPENELIQRAKSGDEAAFTALVEAYSKRIFNIGLRMLGSREDAADMTQDALLKIYRYLDSFRGDAAFPPGYTGLALIAAGIICVLLIVAVNCLLAILRKMMTMALLLRWLIEALFRRMFISVGRGGIILSL